MFSTIKPFLSKKSLLESLDLNSTSGINLQIEKCALIKKLTGCIGLDEYKGRLDYYDDRWLEFEIGYIFSCLGESPEFNVFMDNAPKDIILRREKGEIHIECKKIKDYPSSILMEKMAKSFKGDRVDFSKTFGRQDGRLNKKYFIQGNWPGLPDPVEILSSNDWKLVQKGIQDKNCQLINGICNIIAIDITSLRNNFEEISNFLKDGVDFSAYPNISGILLFFSEQEYQVEGYNFRFFLIPNSFSQVKIPENIKIEPQKSYKIEIRTNES